ncbi:MAG: hypothetical protein IPL33_12530 [Sphingobacteriales bacterium]|nr:hypothetical protein [Sphingobacteriales bacterium]
MPMRLTDATGTTQTIQPTNGTWQTTTIRNTARPNPLGRRRFLLYAESGEVTTIASGSG